MNARVVQDSAASLLQSSSPAAKVGAAGLGVVVTALWHAFTGVLALAMVILFFCDLLLGVFKAVHLGGIHAFDYDRFGRAFAKLGAAMVGIVMAVVADLLLREIGAVQDATYVTSGILGGISVGFVVSAGKNLAYFFPQVGSLVDTLARRSQEPPKRRASDAVEGS